MNYIEIIALTVGFIALLICITILGLSSRKSDTKVVPKTPTPPPIWTTETKTVKNEPNDDIVTFSTNKEEAKVIEEALDEHRKREDRPVSKSEAESNLSRVNVNPEDFDRSLLISIEEGITALEQDTLKAARSGDVEFVKKAFQNLDWMEEIRDRLQYTLEEPGQ